MVEQDLLHYAVTFHEVDQIDDVEISVKLLLAFSNVVLFHLSFCLALDQATLPPYAKAPQR